MRKVLIVEDDIEISDLLEIHLGDLNCEITKVFDGKSGLELAEENFYDLIVLDIMLPEIDGFEVCREIRKKETHTPILMLTSKSEEMDKVLGLEFGADDYLTKPFSIREFIARVKAIFRRTDVLKSDVKDKKVISFDDLTIHGESRKITLKGNRIELTPKEFDLLFLMASHPGRSYSREQLLNTIWGYQFSGYDHTVNSHINRLRVKIENDVSKPKYILTTWGIGYRFNDQI